MAAPPLELPYEARTLSTSHRVLMIVGDIFIMPSSVYFLYLGVARCLEYWAAGDFVRAWLAPLLGIPMGLFLFGMVLVGLDLVLKRVRMSAAGVSISGLYRRGFSWTEVISAKIEIEKHSVSLLIKTKQGQKFEIGIADEKTYNASCLIVQHYSRNAEMKATAC